MAGKKMEKRGKGKRKGAGKVREKKKGAAEVKGAKDGEVREIADAEFEPFVKENNIVLVDFFAEWCMPCVMMEPIIEELAKTLAGKVNFAKINVGENHDIASQYKIMSIPTLLIFKKGSLIERITGALSYDMLKEKISVCLRK